MRTLLATATVIDGLLARASVDQSVEQLRARHRIGMGAAPSWQGVGTRRKVGVDSSCMAGSSQSVAPAAPIGAAVG